MTRDFQSDPSVLKKKLNLLTNSGNGGTLESDKQEAVAEILFRIAIHTETNPKEAFEKLRKAYKLDGTNPKYAYHLARLYYIHGDFGKSAIWLNKAAELCPTSHRIWTHISLIQKELNNHFKEDSEYEPDELKKVGEKIFDNVKKGIDVFKEELMIFQPHRSIASIQSEQRKKQGTSSGVNTSYNQEENSDSKKEPTTTERILNKRTCRWTGVYDLEIEALLENLPSERNRDILLPKLEEILVLIPNRKRGVSAFVIIAIEWLLSGYPVTTIQRLAKKLPDNQDLKWIALLNHVCELYECDLQKLPEMLGRYLDDGNIPSIIAAIVHKQRLLWHPFNFSKVSSFASAKKLIKEYPTGVSIVVDNFDEDIMEYIQSLKLLGDSLNPQKKKDIEDLPLNKTEVPEFDLTTSKERLDALTTASEEAIRIKQSAFTFLKESIEVRLINIKNDDDYSRVVQDLSAFRKLTEALSDFAKKGLEKLEVVMKYVATLTDQEVDLSFRSNLGNCKNKYSELVVLGNFQKILIRLEKKLKDSEARFTIFDVKPDQTIEFHIKRLTTLIPDDKGITSQSSEDNETINDLNLLEKKAKEISITFDLHWRILKELVTKKQNGVLMDSEKTEVSNIASFIKESQIFIESTLVQLLNMRNSGTCLDIARLDKLEPLVKNLNIRITPFNKNLNKLEVLKTNSTPVKPQEESGENQESHILTSIEKLSFEVNRIDKEIAKLFQQMDMTFSEYSDVGRNSEPVHSLYAMMKTRQAEVYYRLGNRTESRKIWNSLVVKDRLNLGILKNLAVCDFYNQDISRSLASWKNYCEALYFYAIINNNPYNKARERAEFHENYANAFTPAFFDAKVDSHDWRKNISTEALIVFLRSPSRLRSYFDHKILAIFNRKLDFTSPPLVIGVSRIDNEENRTEAKKKLEDFTNIACVLLPQSVQSMLSKLCKDYFTDAYINCKNPESLTIKKDPAYSDEKDQQMHWVLEVCQVLFKFYLVMFDKEVMQEVGSFDLFVQFQRLKEVPIKLNNSFLQPALQKFGLTDYDSYLKLHENLTRKIVESIMFQIIRDIPDSAGKARQQYLYKELIEEWVIRTEFEEFFDFIDDPQSCYPEVVFDAFKNETSNRAAAIIELRKLHEKLPHITGPARLLALLFSKNNQQDEMDEAVRLLKSVIPLAFHKKGLDECNDLLKSFGVKQALVAGDFQKTIEKFKQIVRDDPNNLTNINSMKGIYYQWINSNIPEAAKLVPRITADFNECLVLENTEISDEMMHEIIKVRRELVLRAATARFGEMDQKTSDWKAIDNSLDLILKEDPDHMEAINIKMLANFSLATKEPLKSKTEILVAIKCALRLIKDSHDSSIIQNASKIKEQFEEHCNKMGWD